MLLPIETQYDETNNIVSATTDRVGTYCLMDMELFFHNLGIEPSKSADVEGSEAMSENSIDNDDYMCYTVYELEARSSNPEDEGYIGSVSTYKDNFDVYFVVDRANFSDEVLRSYCTKILETAEKIWTVSPNVNVILYAVNGDGFSNFDNYGRFKNASNLKAALDTIKHNDTVLTPTLSKAVDSVINSYDGNRKIYGFVFFDSSNTIFQNKNDSKALLYGVKYGGRKIDISVCSNIPEKYKSAQNYDEMAYAVALYKMTNGIDISANDFTNQALEHIYGEIPVEGQYQYPAIIAAGYQPVVLDSPLTEQDRDNAQKLIGTLDENNTVIESNYKFSEAELEDCTDTDEDGLWDFEEVMFYLCGNPVIYFDEYGEIELPTVNDILGKGDGKAAEYFNAFSTLAYVKSGYDKAQERYADSWDTFVGFPVLPIFSDPTVKDGDGDTVFDKYDCNKLVQDDLPSKFIDLINQGTMQHQYVKLYEDVLYVYAGYLSEDILKSFWSELSLKSSNNANLFYYTDVDGTEIYGLTSEAHSNKDFAKYIAAKHILYKICSHNRGTISIGPQISVTPMNIKISGSLVLTADTYGNAAIQFTYGEGIGISSGVSGLLGINFTLTSALDYEKLNGLSAGAGGSAAFGIGGGSDFIVFRDCKTNELYYGVSRSVGTGLGVDVNAHCDRTYTIYTFNYFTIIDDSLSKYIQESILSEERN